MRRLLIRPGAIGDCLLTFPAMEALKADYTEVWLPGVMKPLVQFADRVESIASTGLDWLAIPGVEGLQRPVLDRLAGFDSIVSWYGTHQPEFREAVSHLPVQFFPALPPPPGQPRIHVPEQPRTRILVHPFSGSPVKDWPLERWDALAPRLGAEFAIGRDRRPLFEDLYQLACWLASAKLYVGNDSGITHLAAAVGTPVVALFGPTDPGIWAPRGEQVVIIKKDRLEEITVDDVTAAVERCLAGSTGC
ncbi:MAG: glycosyltransferase family 9 protein [Acidobacteria bacterium]|nr:glycosyltransferase family 9 protein [Acidobacteriota bacterium]